MQELLLIILANGLVNNVVLSRFLGCAHSWGFKQGFIGNRNGDGKQPLF